MCTQGLCVTSDLKRRIADALREDIGACDVTTEATVDKRARGRGILVAKQQGVLAGMPVAALVCRSVDTRLRLLPKVKEGNRIRPGQRIAFIEGPAGSILTAERTLLNYLQHLSGIATTTHEYVSAVKGTGAIILDTRKTTPLWRDLEKYAVRVGGASNHRMGLYDAVLIKDNHIAAAGSIGRAVERVKAGPRQKHLVVEVETKTLVEVKQAYACGVDRIMLDNMPPALMRKAVRWLRSQPRPVPETEASGGVGIANVRRIARTGVNYISVGALTHSAPALDISLNIF